VRIGYSIVIPEAGKTEFKRSSFIANLETGPKISLDGMPQWNAGTVHSEESKEGKQYSLNLSEEQIEFVIKGVIARTETLRKLKDHDEEPRYIEGKPAMEQF